MALQGHLKIAGRTYGVVECAYEFNQQVDDTGKPTSRPQGGKITFVIPSTSDDDQVRTYWQADGNVEAQAVRVLVYGSDIYVMTLEHNLDTDAWCTRVWMNHTLKGTVNGIIGNAFVVI